MDKIVFFWVESCNNLDGLSVNFGGKHKFTFRENSLSVEDNEDFPDNFFYKEKEGFENVSVIVGKNASGKSSFLKALRYVYSGAKPPKRDGNDSNYLLVIEKDKKYLYYSDIDSIITPQTSDSILIERATDGIRERKLVFYASSYDFASKTYSYQQLSDIDVSSDALLKKDELEATSNVYDTHKMNEVYRQLDFLKTENAKDVEKYINLPDRLDIIISSTGEKHIEEPEINKKFIRGASYENGGEVTEAFNSIFYSEPNNSNSKTIIYSNLHKWLEIMLNNSLIDEPEIENRKKLIKFHAIHHFINNLCFAFDKGGIIQKDKDATAVTISKFTNNNEYTIDKLSEQFDLFADAIALFLSPDALKNLKKCLLDAIEEGDFETHPNYPWWHFYIHPESAIVADLIKYYDIYRVHLAYKSKGVGNSQESKFSSHFIDFDWRAISTGERAFLNLFARMNHAKEQLKKGGLSSTILILIDEGELGFHLEWQKKYVKILLDTLPLIFKFDGEAPQKIQIILTTHSPVSLSDIPSTNVIYLNDGKVKGVSENTFGANIHSLYKHSFFLEGMPIGEFAKAKIEKLFKDLRGKKSFTRAKLATIKKQIQMIGEPLLKNELMKLYNEKCNIEERISELEKEIAKLKRQNEQ